MSELRFVRPVTGVDPPLREDQQCIVRVLSGDEIVLSSFVALKDGAPVTPQNSHLYFALAENQFEPTPLWSGEWRKGIEEAAAGVKPGAIKITVPDAIASTLRRGSYSFALTVEDVYHQGRYTALQGTLLMEYSPASPNHSVSYKPDTWED